MAIFSFTDGVLPAGATVTRAAGPYSFTGANGLTQFGTVANIARFDFDQVSRAFRGLLLEPSRTNVHLDSAAFDNWANRSNITLTANNAIAPDGTMTAETLTPTADNVTTNIRRGSIAFSVAAQLIFSVHVRSATTPTVSAIQAYNTANAASIVASFTTQSDWRRISTRYTMTPAGIAFFIGSLAGAWKSGALQVWGAMVEEVPAGQVVVPTTYIPTTNAVATRPAETLSLNWAPQGIGDGLYSVLYTFADGSMQAIEQQVTGGVSTVLAASLKNYTIRSISILETPPGRMITLGDIAPRSATLIDADIRSATLIDAGSRSATILT